MSHPDHSTPFSLKGLARTLRTFAIVGAAGLATSLTTSAIAKATDTDAEEDTWVAVVTADDVYLRSGASKSYYHFGYVKEGDLVLVTGRKFKWARIAAVGPVFDELYGLIKLKSDEADRIDISEDGRTAVVHGRTEVQAPNLASSHPLQGVWKAIDYLPPESTVNVVETVNVDLEVYHKVRLRPQAVAWISENYLRKATPMEVAAWERAVAPATSGDAERDERASMGATTDAASANPTRTSSLEDDATPGTDVPVIDDATTSGTSADVTEHTASTDAPSMRDTPAMTPTATSTGDEARSMAPRRITPPAESTPTTPERGTLEQRMDPVRAPEDTTGTGETTPRWDDVTTPPTADGAATPTDLALDRPTLPPLDSEFTVNELEQRFELLGREPIEEAELAPLRSLYLALADREGRDSPEGRYAVARAEQLRIWGDLQQRKQELRQLRFAFESASSDAEAIRQMVARQGVYAAVGRLSSSTIYDGRELPRLLRVQDPTTGRTIAYVRPDASADVDLFTLVGQIIGVVGDKQYDGGLRLNLVQPDRIDVLAPDR